MSSYNLRLLPSRKAKIVVRKSKIPVQRTKNNRQLSLKILHQQQKPDQCHNNPGLIEVLMEDQNPVAAQIPPQAPQPVPPENQQQGQPPAVNDQMNPIPVQQNINPLMVSFKPSSFNGLHPETAGRWWHNFERYANLGGIHGNDRCMLLGLLLT